MTTLSRRQLMVGGVVADADRAPAGDRGVAAVDHGAGLGQARRRGPLSSGSAAPGGRLTM